MKPRFLVVIPFVFALTLAHSCICCAGFIVSFSSETTNVNFTVNPTETFTIGVQLAADTGTQNIQGYSIPIDFRNPVGAGLPMGWNVLSVTSVANFSGGILFTGRPNPGLPPPTEGDAYGSDTRTAGPLTFTTTPVRLFDVTVQINRANAINGDFTASFLTTGALFNLNDSATTTLPANQINATGLATIRVTGVPEPSSLALLFTSCILACLFFVKRFSRLRNFRFYRRLAKVG